MKLRLLPLLLVLGGCKMPKEHLLADSLLDKIDTSLRNIRPGYCDTYKLTSFEGVEARAYIQVCMPEDR